MSLKSRIAIAAGRANLECKPEKLRGSVKLTAWCQMNSTEKFLLYASARKTLLRFVWRWKWKIKIQINLSLISNRMRERDLTQCFDINSRQNRECLHGLVTCSRSRYTLSPREILVQHIFNLIETWNYVKHVSLSLRNSRTIRLIIFHRRETLSSTCSWTRKKKTGANWHHNWHWSRALDSAT